MSLTREQLLGTSDAATLPPLLVHTPELGGDVYVRHVGALEMDDFDAVTALMRAKDKERPIARNLRARFVAFVLCDQTGKRICDDTDAVALGKKSTAAIDRIFAAGCELNGKGAKAEEDIRKNSEATPAAENSTG